VGRRQRTADNAEPLPGVTPDVQSAILVIDIIHGYCSGASGLTLGPGTQSALPAREGGGALRMVYARSG
jgi:hypothetical protein